MLRDADLLSIFVVAAGEHTIYIPRLAARRAALRSSESPETPSFLCQCCHPPLYSLASTYLLQMRNDSVNKDFDDVSFVAACESQGPIITPKICFIGISGLVTLHTFPPEF